MDGCKNNIILKKSNGRDGFYIFRSGGDELLCRRITDGVISKQTDILFPGPVSDFDVTIDESDTLHIVFCNNDGSIVYMRNTKEKWTRGYLLKAKEKSDIRPKSFFVSKYKNEISVAYVIGQQDNKIVCCQTVGERIERPVALDSVCAENDSIFALQDLSGNILIFYTDKELKFGYKRYSKDNGKWSAFVCIEEGRRRVRQFYACCDKSSVYMCYKINGGIRFRCITGANGKVSAEQTLTRKHIESCSDPVLSCKDEKIRLMWSDRRYVVSSETEKTVYRWSRMEEKKIAEAEQIILFKLCDAYSEIPEHNLGYIRNDRVRFWNSDEYFNIISTEKKLEHSKKVVEDNYLNQADDAQYPKIDIEKERARIMEEMGIPRRKENPASGFWEVDTDEANKEVKMEKSTPLKHEKPAQSSDSVSGEILKELKNLAEMVSGLKNEVEKIKGVIRINAMRESEKTKKKRISAKVHKK